MSEKTVDLSEYRDLDLDEVTMRTTTSIDMLDAAARCVPADPTAGVDPHVFHIQIKQELIACAIVAYKQRGSQVREHVNGPCVAARSWSSRTREYLGELYNYLNDVSMQEREDFRAKLAGRPGGESSTQRPA